jgi:hypothetical protein
VNSLAVRTSAIECFCDRSVRRIASRKVPNLEGAKCRKPVLLRTGFPVPCEATGGIGRDEGLTDSLGGGVSTQLQQPKMWDISNAGRVQGGLAAARFWSAPGPEHDQAAAAGPDRLRGLRTLCHYR